jgi:hypothetical protein
VRTFKYAQAALTKEMLTENGRKGGNISGRIT